MSAPPRDANMTRREHIATFAITPLLRAAGTYRSLAEALAHREDAVSVILNRTPVMDHVGPLQHLRSLILNANDLEVLPPGIEKLNDFRAVFIGGSPRGDFALFESPRSKRSCGAGQGRTSAAVHRAREAETHPPRLAREMDAKG